ncbi:MAG: protein translocase subunit SecF [Actinobacteria bacterium]|nr:protein translocase subunit SecF [Actinomycetota bacterium]
MLEDAPASEQAPKPHGVFSRLYRGETSFDFVGRRRWWYLISTLVILAGLVSFATRGLNLGIDFKGGTSWELQAPGVSASQARGVLRKFGLGGATVEILGGKTLEVQADLNNLSAAQHAKVENEVSDALAGLAHVSPSAVSTNDVGPTWGGQITNRAILALIVFFVAIGLYISLRFEWKMAVAAMVAVFHDILVTAGIYALTGFQVTPDTVIAVLTILGYSIYDTIVVFDRVRENARGLGATGKMTYASTVNLSMNQTLARSINTSLVAIMPILSVLVLGAYVLGATTLQYFGLALTIGLASGAYSSLFIASPLLASMKEHEPRYASIRHKLASRGEEAMFLTPAAAARGLDEDADGSKVSRRRSRGRSPAPSSGALVPSALATKPARQVPSAPAAPTAVLERDSADRLNAEDNQEEIAAAAAPSGTKPTSSRSTASRSASSSASGSPRNRQAQRGGGQAGAASASRPHTAPRPRKKKRKR